MSYMKDAWTRLLESYEEAFLGQLTDDGHECPPVPYDLPMPMVSGPGFKLTGIAEPEDKLDSLACARAPLGQFMNPPKATEFPEEVEICRLVIVPGQNLLFCTVCQHVMDPPPGGGPIDKCPNCNVPIQKKVPVAGVVERKS